MQLPGLRGLPVWHVLKQAFSKFFGDDMPTYGAALALRVLLALFPFLIFLTALLGFLGAPGLFDWMREQASYVVPAQGMEAVDNVLSDLQTPRGGLMSFGILLAIYSASIAIAATMNALNVAYEVNERRPVWKRYLVAIVYTVGLAALLTGAALLMVVGPDQLRWLAGYVGLGELFIPVWTLLRWPVAVVLLMLTLALVYWAAPNVKQPFRLISPGAVLAVVVWIGASLLFGFYVQNFAHYDATYGSIGAVVVLIFYFYLSAAVMLFGAEFNAVIERETGQVVEQES
jgi:membrane protein